MTSYSAISNSSIAAGEPITVGLMTALRDNPIAISEGASGAPRMIPGITYAVFTSNTTWSVPAGITELIIELWTAGGGGGAGGSGSPESSGTAGGNSTIGLNPGGGGTVNQITGNGSGGGIGAGGNGTPSNPGLSFAGTISSTMIIGGAGSDGGAGGRNASGNGGDGVSGNYAVGRLAVDGDAGDEIAIVLGAGGSGASGTQNGANGNAARCRIWY